MGNENLSSFYKGLSHNNEKYKLTKEQLIDPRLKECLENDYFDNKTKFICSSPLYFNEEESQVLISNYNAMKSNNNELSFEETIVNGGLIGTKGNNIVSLDRDVQIKERTFSEVMQVNEKLSKIAKKINGGFIDENGKKQQLSPYEKYLLCLKIVHNIDYYCQKGIWDDNSTRSFIETVKNNKGCCGGKAEYLNALLYMVGINSCRISVNSKSETLSILKTWKDTDFNTSFADGKTIDEKIEQATQNLTLNEEDKTRTDHALNLIYIDDDKYDKHGVFAGDATVNYEMISIENLYKTGVANITTFYLGGKDVNNFIKKINPNKELNKDNQHEIDREYFQSLKFMIIEDLKKETRKYDDNEEFSLDIKKFLKQVSECLTFREMCDLFKEKCSGIKKSEYNDLLKQYNTENAAKFVDLFKQNANDAEKTVEYSKKYKEIINKFMINYRGHLGSALTAIDARNQLENVPQFKMSYNLSIEISKKIDKIYEDNFRDKDAEFSVESGDITL